MKTKKTLIKEVYVRIYDKKIAEKYDSVKSSRREKISDNEFVQELIKLGLSVLTVSKDEAENFVDASNEIKRLLGVVVKEIRSLSKEKILSTEINNKRQNAIYNLLVAQTTGEEVTEKEIEEGMYDTLPERFIDEIKQRRVDD